VSTSEIDADRPLLEVSNLHTSFTTSYGLVTAVDGVSTTLRAGETLGVVGESGSGKSVLVRSIMNLLPSNAVISDDTRVLFGGRDIRQLPKWETTHLWGPQIAMIFQDPMTSLNPVKRIGTQLTESMRFHLKLSRKEALDRALDLMNQVRIPEPRRRLEQYPHELSGGMRQRVTIAIALSCEPRLLIADEPTTALDVTVQKQILDLLRRLHESRNMAMILITHDLGVVAGFADRVAVMYAGQFVEAADTVELFDRVRHPYTEALLNSIPRVEQPSHSRLDAISGRPPHLINPPRACRFAPRCRYAQPSCLDRAPELEADGQGHWVRCFFPAGTPAGQEALGLNRQTGHTAAGLQLAQTVAR
jgi:peptide/nickel transport system ATP-binding protein